MLLVTTERVLWCCDKAFLFINQSEVDFAIAHLRFEVTILIALSFSFSSITFILLWHINLLKPTGYVMHHQFNIQQLYALPTLYLCVLYLSENKQRLVPLTA